MLDRLRKRFETLLGARDASPADEETQQTHQPVEEPAPPPVEVEDPAQQARREAQRRESRLILTERIHNRAAVLLNELRSDLVQDIHRKLEEEVPSGSLTDLLQVTLDSGFTSRLDAAIEERVAQLIERLEREFEDAEAKDLLPGGEDFAADLRSYRDSMLKKHLLEQIEVLALPTSAEAFATEASGSQGPKERIAQYWRACREALDRFFRSVEMVLLDGAHEGIRLESALIRERLVAAQYRNGYRLLDERFRSLFGEIVQFQMSPEPQGTKRALLDRRVVDEIVVPLAYFIRERKETEPRPALRSRAELFREIVDKLVIVPEPFTQTTEAIKPVLRKSVEQARPLAIEGFPFLRTAIASMSPVAIHRTTALLEVFEALVQQDLDETILKTVEQSVRLSRAQYRLYQLLVRGRRAVLERLTSLDRVADEDASRLADLVEQTDPPAPLVEDALLKLDYLPWPDALPARSRELLRLVALLTLPLNELASTYVLYGEAEPSAEDRARLAQAVLQHVGPTSAGFDERLHLGGAAPRDLDVDAVLGATGHGGDKGQRVAAFRDEIRSAIEDGQPEALARVVERLRLLIEAVERKASAPAKKAGADPYLVEVWTEGGGTVGLVRFAGRGYGLHPVELARRPASSKGADVSSKLALQLRNQAVIYQAFHQLFSRPKLLPKEQRRALPSYVKRVYEPAEPNRLVLMSRLRHAKEMVGWLESFRGQIAEADPDRATAAKGVRKVLLGLEKKLEALSRNVEHTRAPGELARSQREYERAVKYLNTIVVHAVNPWLERQTAELGTAFEFQAEEVERAVRSQTSRHGLDWENDVESFEAHGIRGTLGCRALLRLADGSSKVVLLNYDRKRQQWQVRHIGPRLTDVVREALRQHGKTLPDDYDEKFEQPTFSLDEQSCRFLYLKRDEARVEATLVLAPNGKENAWRVVYLKFNDEVLTDRLGE